MTEIVFNEEESVTRPAVNAPHTPSFQEYLVRFGVAQNEKQATFILLIASAALIVLSAFLLFSGQKGGVLPSTTPTTSGIINPAIIH